MSKRRRLSDEELANLSEEEMVKETRWATKKWDEALCGQYRLVYLMTTKAMKDKSEPDAIRRSVMSVVNAGTPIDDADPYYLKLIDDGIDDALAGQKPRNTVDPSWRAPLPPVAE